MHNRTSDSVAAAVQFCEFRRDGNLLRCKLCGRLVKTSSDTRLVAKCRAGTALPVAALQARVSHGPGTELKSLLRRVGITAAPNCSCNARARKMDEEEAREPGWCEAHLGDIVGWLRDEATKRGLPFFDIAGRILVRRAIRNAKRASVG